MTETTGGCHFPPPGSPMETIGYPLPSVECKVSIKLTVLLFNPAYRQNKF